jgi:type 1 glutamine amidotransferase
MAKALVVWGGWDGHQPKEVGEVCTKILRDDGFEVIVSDTLDSFKDKTMLAGLNLIVPIWTMGKLEGDAQNIVCEAVRETGVGMAGCHGGMCDAFRDATEWQFMTGGQWVSHPGNDGTKYTVEIKDKNHEITKGIGDFGVSSEQYYMHVDPAVKVLASCKFPTPGADGPHVPNGTFDMPVVWTKWYGKGKIFYSSIGHRADVFAMEPHLTLMRRGFKWAAKK